ncbi:flagellar export chaperone FliS [Simiduia sp. 21SJ11W-1]|uniref:flagellar export chaperone FliS n=1 Tax=Simiduia sp. 21SJ11W-1 TaxID=2909669 RepID=UPI00209F61D5|nr:flagellar export chaperone FliS [Simiduia sp. 21SJ11W-1]UTA49478.1 flagellar export chaperone FliS [Simiduia sp. 21SJ11W-1]
MQHRKGGDAYKQLHMESIVADASPHKLITLLFSQTRAQLKSALVAHQANNTGVRREAIHRAVECLSGLREALNFEVESDLPHNLHKLYLYMQQSLIACQREFSEAKVVEILSLLETLADAWAQIDDAATGP